MDFTRAVDNLKAAEDELLKLIAQDCSYEEKRRCLDYSKAVHDLVLELEGSLSLEDLVKEMTPAPVESSECDELDFPLFFVYEGKLWKVARRSGAVDALYWKSALLSEVRNVCGTLCQMPVDASIFTVADVEGFLKELPTYKIQLTVMALLKAGMLKQAGRGKYAFADGAIRAEKRLVEAIESLPAYPELLDK